MPETNTTTAQRSSGARLDKPIFASIPADKVAAGQPTNGGNGKPTLRHVLNFEQPLAKLEQQIHELEAMQAHKQVDYSKELRHLRSNYTSLLRKTYDNLSAWETVQVARHPARRGSGRFF